MNVPNLQTARVTALAIRRRLDDISRSMVAAPGLVRIARDVNGDQIAFWNNGTSVEYNISQAQRLYEDIERAFPDATKTRSGKPLRIELPLSN